MKKKQQQKATLFRDKATEQVAVILARLLNACRDRFVWCMRVATNGLSPLRIKIIALIAVLAGSVLFASIIFKALTSKAPATIHLPRQLILPARPLSSPSPADNGLQKALERLHEIRNKDSIGYQQFLLRHPGFEDTIKNLLQ